ncbi:hypothetical protein KR51_00012080 [Rubidibacter lacunae KORDI 51-2]|uniref:Biotin transporter n=1 Tax=Rubidibacter lacunae KORDI 51-2 TaxID=582515 RepID=U5DNE7_9CHRO|nr:biotin transporter BioY [Rubidibacter lacunae]ERN42119.1 hypothetical protein KR51_00012080 [Rubidibacter lacunae KORDI 51-2]
MSFSYELLWTLIGLLLTIGGTFVEAFATNPPWQWGDLGLKIQTLGVTFQTGAVLLTGCVGGKKAGALSQVAYLMLGLAWLPVFSHGGGWSYLQQPTFGYILGFVPGAWLCGWLAFRDRPKIEMLVLASAAGLVVIHACGLLYLTGLAFIGPKFGATGPPLLAALSAYSLKPLPGQLAVLCAAATIAFGLRQVQFN